MKQVVKVLIFLFPVLIYAQNSDVVVQEPAKISVEAAKNDFISLVKTLKEYHTGFTWFNTMEKLDESANALLTSINDSISELEFHHKIRLFLTNIYCGHTLAIPSEQSYAHFKADYKFLPFEIYYTGGKLYIKDFYENIQEELIGVELISIDGKKVSEILTDFKQIQQRDGFHESFVNHQIANNFRIYYRFLYEQKNTYEIEYLKDGKLENTMLQAATTPADKEKQTTLDSIQYTLDFKSDYVDLYQVNANKNWAVLKIKSFDTRNFKKLYKSTFETIKNDSINHLVVDLRGNGGGYFPNGNYFLRYLIKEKFNYHFYEYKKKKSKDLLKPKNSHSLTKFIFTLIPDKLDKDGYRTNSMSYKPIKKNAYDGSLYVLTDGGTFSMASSVSAYLKQYTDAKFIGTETGGGAEGSNGILMSWFTLPASKIRVMIPFFHVEHSFYAKEKGRGVVPDIEINYSITDLIEGKDKELEYLFNFYMTK